MTNRKKMAQKMRTPIKLAAALLLSMAGTGQVAHAVISQQPMFMAIQLKPNIMFTFDDSGSMNWNCIPDSICPLNPIYPAEWKIYISFPFNDASDTDDIRKWRANAFNGLAYNPKVRYLPWQKADGTYFANSDPSYAWGHPNSMNKHVPQLVEVEKGKPKVLEADKNCSGDYGCNLINTDKNANYYAFYYNYDAASGAFTRVEIKKGVDFGSAHPDRTDCTGKCTYEQEITNFANWYTYHRTRMLTAIAGASQAFNPLTGNQRVGFGIINQLNTWVNKEGETKVDKRQTVDGETIGAVSLGVRDFSGDARKAFYDKLFSLKPWGYFGTPLRLAVDEIGNYFKRTDDLGPWGEFPGTGGGKQYSCRKNYHILMTDGYWNNSQAETIEARTADQDKGTTHTNPQDGKTYTYDPATAGKQYSSAANSTLADVAMYYWNRDLRPDMPNNVGTTDSDPAFWQHITQFTVGLGVTGTLNYPGDWEAIKKRG